jgi:hypothetical protein
MRSWSPIIRIGRVMQQSVRTRELPRVGMPRIAVRVPRLLGNRPERAEEEAAAMAAAGLAWGRPAVVELAVAALVVAGPAVAALVVAGPVVAALVAAGPAVVGPAVVGPVVAAPAVAELALAVTDTVVMAMAEPPPAMETAQVETETAAAMVSGTEAGTEGTANRAEMN